MPTCIGLDAHARTCTYKVKDENGRLLGGDTIPSSREALSRLHREWPSATVVVEASSVTEWLVEHLQAEGADVRLVHPVNIRRTLGRKSDDLDSGFLADAHLLGVLTECYVPTPEIRRLRQVARQRAFLVQQRTRFYNRIHAILKRRGQKAAAPDGEESYALLEGNRAWLESIDPEIGVMLSLADQVTKRIKASDKQVEKAVRKNPDALRLVSIPGVGNLTALVLYGELGDVTRFPNGEAVAAYFGLVPSEAQSGDTMRRGHITRRGSSLARFVLVQAAWVHVRRCPESSITKAYNRLARRIGKQRAIVATARRLCKVAYCVLREKRAFVAER